MPLQATHLGSFRTTHWTVVLEAAQSGGELAQESLGQLYQDYWYPLYAYVRRRGHLAEAAEDITQDFFSRLIEKNSLAGLEREGGRFRSFLLRSMENFLLNHWHQSRARKRGGGNAALSLDGVQSDQRYALEKPDNETPETLFERQWVFALLGRVKQQLRDEHVKGGKGDLFDALQPCLQGDRSGPEYSDVAARFGMSTGAIKVTVHRMRQHYGELLRAEIVRTVSSPEEVEDELRYLIGVVGR